MDYNEWKEEMNRTFSESQNDSTEGQAAEVKEAAGQITEEAAEPVTYSWVNPKLQSGRNTENHESEYSNYQWRASDSQRRSYDSGSHTSSHTEKLPLRVDFIHRVEFGEVSGHRVLIKRGPGNRGPTECGTTQ